jgi:MFS family permease
MGYPSPAKEEWTVEFPSVSESLLTIFTSVTSLTAIAGPFIASAFLSPRLPLGRKGTTFVIALLGTASWLIILGVAEHRFWVGILARALLGFIVGAFSAVVPMYIVEVAPENMSAFFGSIHQICVALGFVVLYLVSSWLRWKSVAIGGAIITAVLCLLVWFVPEPTPKEVEPGEEGEEPVKSESPFQKKWVPKLVLGALLAFFQQLSGINAILVNLHSLFAQAQLDMETGYASAIAASAQVIACLIASFVIDSLGRRLVWIVSFGGIAVTDIVYGITELDSIRKSGSIPAILPIVIIFLNLLSFGAGAGPIPWFIVPELFPDSVRANAVSLVTACNWIFAFAVVQLFPYMRDGMGLSGVFILYGVVSAVSAIYGAFFLKSTRQEEEMEDAGVPVFEGKGSRASGSARASRASHPSRVSGHDEPSPSTVDPLIEDAEAPL